MQAQNEEKKQIYELLILKHDQNHIVALSTDSYDKCYETWKTLVDLWTKSVSDKVPFILTEPVVTAFDPGTIKEITVRPLMTVPESKYANPYQKEMMKKGLTGMLQPSNSSDSDLLDQGYR